MRDTPWGKMTYLDYKYKLVNKKDYDEIDDIANQKILNGLLHQGFR